MASFPGTELLKPLGLPMPGSRKGAFCYVNGVLLESTEGGVPVANDSSMANDVLNHA